VVEYEWKEKAAFAKLPRAPEFFVTPARRYFGLSPDMRKMREFHEALILLGIV
jgi:hypothetical protein